MSKHKHFEHLNLTYVIFYFQAMNVSTIDQETKKHCDELLSFIVICYTCIQDKFIFSESVICGFAKSF